MKIGLLKEIKKGENRVALTPAGVETIVQAGHSVLVEHDAGLGSGFADDEYQALGGKLASSSEIFSECDMVMHVKEIQPSEYGLLRKGQIVFTYLHLAPDLEQTQALIKSECVAFAYETIQTPDGRLPLLQPMSEVAGRMAIQEGAKYLEMTFGGRGILLGGVPGVEPANVLILGGGVVGLNAAKMACGIGAYVTLLDASLDRLRYISDILPQCKVILSQPAVLREKVKDADLVVGAVLLPGAKAPRLITREMLKTMKKGAVLVDVAIDQGGCFETSRPTSHADPVFTVDGIIHYCVTNMPGAVARTSTLALTNATLPYVLRIAKGWREAIKQPDVRSGLNVALGKVVYEPIAKALQLPFTRIESLD